MNATSSAASTTLTVFKTVVRTITSCAPTITNCPARSLAGGGVITDTIVLTTTVCPVAAAQSISSSILAAAGITSNGAMTTSPSSTVNIPMGTGVAGSVGNGSYGSSDTTLTYTLGTGSSTTVVTTTIKHTSKMTEYFTVYVTKSQSSGAAISSLAGETTAAQTEEAGTAFGNGPTTTTTQTSTQTKYITVKLAHPSSMVPGNNGGANNGGESGSSNCVPVTVTVAMSTVTVVSLL